MIPVIEFFVPGPPQGKARARTVRSRYGRSTTYTPHKTVAYESQIRIAFMHASGCKNEPPFGQGIPVRIEIQAFYKPPIRTTKKEYARIQAGLKFPTRKPDTDNIIKAVCDALNRFAYHDDAQVV